jgi:hypothetical protein
MSINNFPLALQPIIQQGFLEREFEQALHSRLGYRSCADREEFAVGIGETLTKTRAGLRPAVTTPLAANSNTNLDNGLASGSWNVEQFTITLNHYAATMDLNMVTSRVAIASVFLQNAYVNGEQAARSLDDLARNALFNAYFGGNTFVRTTLVSAGPNVAVDDVRGFQTAFVNGVQQAVSSSNPLAVTVGSDIYTLTSVTVDTTSVSITPGGISGVLGFSGNVTVADGAAFSSVQAATGSLVLRPNGRTNSTLLQAGDTLTMANILDGVANLRLNAVPDVDGAYNCYLDPISARQLFADSDFQKLFIGLTSANEVFSGSFIRRPIVVGKGALVEGDFAGMASDDVAPKDSIVSLVDGVCMVTREPIDRLQQIIAQSWYWIGGFCAPSDTTTNSLTVPTATNANFKRAVMIEHLG